MQFSGIDKRRFDIWRYHDLYGGFLVPEQFRITDQKTQFTALDRRSETLWIKHEDQHPLGSHKGRSLAYQLSVLTAQGQEKCVLSSSGNAAIAFLSLTPSKHSIALVSPHIDTNKLAFLQHISSQGKLIMSPVAKSLGRALVKKHGFIDLRPSQSGDAITGLSSLGFELFEQIPDLSHEYAIVSVTTSGGNILGMAKAFDRLAELKVIASIPRLYPVLLQNYQSGYLSAERKKELEVAVQKSGGKVLLMEPVLAGNEATSFEGNTALAAYLQNSKNLGKTIVLFTGRVWPKAEPEEMKLYTSLGEMDLE